MYILLALYLLLSTLGMVLIKIGGENLNIAFTKSYFGFQFGWISMFGVVFYLVSFILWIIILSKYNLSYISPIASGLAYVLIIVFSRFLLKENISNYQWLGIIVILLGVILMNIKK
ncbi:EamA family transporter [Sebaldella sp. S0638]|uniref:EamA family transporter n=1 Tax=Sebaldella sp. S0638 TaxID=2957809 RepID=UPI00209E7AAB|nr:EamA family transporter [Sebaldella sp. S0638]MCP1223389.1 EamA family transporter [Sebaldella sp. S0638]